MRSTLTYLLFSLSAVCLPLEGIMAQTGLVLQVDSATINLTCGDFFGNPEPMWGVNINGEGFQYYPQEGPCFSPLPNPQFLLSVDCPGDLPAEVEVCFHAFENDPILPPPISCEISPDCEATLCQNFSIPGLGQPESLSLALPDGGAVTGTLFFTLGVEAVSPVATNDQPCDAIDLGNLDFNTSIGDLAGPVYSNYCATNLQEPNPFDTNAFGTFINDQGVWFSFQTGDNPSGVILIDVVDDPLQTGDEFDAQIAVYEYPNGDCSGTPTLVRSRSDNSQFSAQLKLRCAKPNTPYFVLVDGGTFGNESIEGPFSIKITDPGVIEGGDLRCDFEDLGVVPENGSVETDGFRSNFCATDVQDPFVAAFVSQHSVWLSFIAPASGHVMIDAISDTLIQPLGVQLGLYRAFRGTCNGGFQHIKSQFTAADADESMEASCLFGGDRYFILIDGSGSQSKGIFTLSVRDAGDITPLTVQDTTLCPGGSITVGPNTYTTTGNYIDTLTIDAGCDSIVMTNLIVAEPLVVDFEQTKFAFGEGEANAEARVTVTGGLGDPVITWCDGQTGSAASGLIGGTECCVTVVDSAGCIFSECYDIEYVDGVIPIYQDTSVACKGDTDGLIRFSAYGGLPPYNYSWESADGLFTGNGSITVDFTEVLIPNLPAGTYSFNMSDSFRDTTFEVRVNEPPRLVGQLLRKDEITCAGACNGGLEMEILGGTPPYDLQWSNGSNGSRSLTDLCPGNYTLNVTDANGCQITLEADLEEPLPFVATASLVQAVSCYQGSDGQIGVNVQNGTVAEYRWSNGVNTQFQSNLPAGFYQVTVTSDLFCEAVAEVEITQPTGPLNVDIEAIQPISCSGESDGILQALVNGPYQNVDYQWSNGGNTAVVEELPAARHYLQITNEKGCTAIDSLLLEEPPLIETTLSTRDITCLDPPASGVIFIDEISGGLGDYKYSVDGDQFTSAPLINNLPGGNYELIVQDRAGCERQFPVSIQTPPEFGVTLGEEIIQLDLGDSIQIAAIATSQNARYTWDHNDALNGPNTMISPQISTYFRVQAEDTETFCRAEATVFVQVNKHRRVYIPNAFSPNMDGNNDYFFVHGDNDIATIQSLRVFTREGHIVYEDANLMPNDPVRSWDGRLQGQLLSSGVYVYMAEITFVDGLTEVFKGDVALIR